MQSGFDLPSLIARTLQKFWTVFFRLAVVLKRSPVIQENHNRKQGLKENTISDTRLPYYQQVTFGLQRTKGKNIFEESNRVLLTYHQIYIN